MNIIDAVIILLLLFGAVIGFKRGFLHQTVSFIGILAVIVLSFLLKNSLSIIMYENLPFFKFAGLFKGLTALNILLYEILAFLIIFAILSLVLKLILSTTRIIEKIFDLTIVLGIVSKIFGAIFGVIQYYIIAFVFLFVISLPIFNLDFVEGSKYKDKILLNTPVMSGFTKKTTKVVNDFNNLKDEYEQKDNTQEFNRKTLEMFLDNKIITKDSLKKLIDKGKIKVDLPDQLLNR